MAVSRRGNVNYDILCEIQSLSSGDEIEVRALGGTTEIHTVNSVKRVNIHTKFGKSNWNVPFVSFVRIVKQVDQNKKAMEISSLNTKRQEEAKTLIKGEPFYISVNDKDALLFTFDGFGPGVIYGINPINKGRTKIAMNCYRGKVSNVMVTT